MCFEIAFFLGGNHFSHQFYGRIVFARIFFATPYDNSFAETALIRFHFNIERSGLFDADCSRFVTDAREAQPSVLERQAVMSFRIGLCAASFFKYNVYKGQFLSRFGISHQSRHFLGGEGQCQHGKRYQEVQSFYHRIADVGIISRLVVFPLVGREMKLVIKTLQS